MAKRKDKKNKVLTSTKNVQLYKKGKNRQKKSNNA
jgi:hypothetical protein